MKHNNRFQVNIAIRPIKPGSALGNRPPVRSDSLPTACRWLSISGIRRRAL